MRKENRTEFRLISHSNSTQFEKDVKSFLDEHQDSKELQIQFNTTTKGHFAYITYVQEVLVSEDIRDDFILDGQDYRCGECPFWCDDFSCTKRVVPRPRYGRQCCLYFYQELAKGNIVPIDSAIVDEFRRQERRGK